VDVTGPQRLNTTGAAGSSLGRLCVVIPAYNEDLLIDRCLSSILRAGVTADNIFVVNDRSTDNTAAVASRVPGVHLLTNERQLGKLGSLRHAIAHFDLARRFDYLSLLDADSHVAPEYFVNVVQRFSASPDAVLVCGAPSSDRCNWLTAYRALEYAITLTTYRKGQDALGVITVAPGCASTYRTSVLDRFDWDGGTLVEDMDLTVQVHRKGLGRVQYADDAVAYTQDPRRISEFIGQMTRWYSGTWQVFRLHRIPFGGQRIDAEFAVLTAEGLVYGVVTLLLPLLALLRPSMVGRWLLIDQLLWLVLAVACAARARRLDVLAWLPTFPILRYVNAAILLRTFWLEIIRGQRRRQWFSVARYAAGPMHE
jgi:poly-beta-1,6-N-acetyl-D-glucosamine synthase